MELCIKHMKRSLHTVRYQRPKSSLQMELLLTETLRALSLHTEALQNAYKMSFSAQFSDTSLEPLQCLSSGFL